MMCCVAVQSICSMQLRCVCDPVIMVRNRVHTALKCTYMSCAEALPALNAHPVHREHIS
jgi:hypothetical protein